jgi:hypothetical protein
MLATTHPGYAALADPLSGFAAKRVKLIFYFFSAPLCDAVGEEGQTGGASSG